MGKVPKVPNRIMGIKETDIPYRANYDRLAKIINELGQEYKQTNWIKSAELFDNCGKNIETIVAYIVEYCCNGKQIVHDRENREAEDLAVQIANDSGIASTWDVLGAIEEYLNLSIQDALQSNNSIIRMFAILDRRVGERTLLAVQGEYSNSEEWLKEFYELRMQAEGLCNT